MAMRMYIYRADYKTAGESRVHFFYARNAKVARANIPLLFHDRPTDLKLTKIGLMKDDVGQPAAVMNDEEEAHMILINFGANQKFSERDE